MLDLLKDAKQTALETGEKAIRLFFEIVAVASERMHSKPGGAPEYQAPYTPPAPPAPAPAPAAPAAPAPAAAKPAPAPAAAKPKPKAKPRRTASKRGGKKRPDQLLRVLGLLHEGGDWLSAKEISDAGAAAGTPILPGNVRKVIRARGDEVIETRPREGSRRGALEYRVTDAGKQKLGV